MKKTKSSNQIQIFVAMILAGCTSQVFAGEYVYDAVATVCTADCDNYVAFSGLPDQSSIEATFNIDVGANDAFDINDVTGFNILISNPASPPMAYDGTNTETANPLPIDVSVAVIEATVTGASGTITTGGTTDADGEVSAQIVLRFTAGPFADANAWMIFDVGAGNSRSARICLDFVNSGCAFGDTQTIAFLGNIALAGADADGDGITDDVDNCTNTVNSGQEDTDGDGHGNICDADFDQNCFANFSDLTIMRTGFFGIDANLDLNSSGGPVNFLDLAIMQGLFFAAPGPSAPGSLCNP